MGIDTVVTVPPMEISEPIIPNPDRRLTYYDLWIREFVHTPKNRIQNVHHQGDYNWGRHPSNHRGKGHTSRGRGNHYADPHHGGYHVDRLDPGIMTDRDMGERTIPRVHPYILIIDMPRSVARVHMIHTMINTPTETRKNTLGPLTVTQVPPNLQVFTGLPTTLLAAQNQTRLQRGVAPSKEENEKGSIRCRHFQSQ